MVSNRIFPSLQGWEPTRDTLHWYAQAVGAIPRALADPRPNWWHISLKVHPDGLATDSMALPGGGTFYLRMDLLGHQVALVTIQGETRHFSMMEGLSSIEFGDQLIGAVVGLGLSADYARQKFENDEPRPYDPEVAEKYFALLTNVDRIFKAHRANLGGEKGPVQLWPHGFDLAFEWFGTRRVEYEEHGQTRQLPAQLNLGFSPGEAGHPQPYFYSNPWPFEEAPLVGKPLPSGARWFTESWKGSILPYEELVDDERAEERLLAYARAVYEISAPTLQA
ncbi:MAG TPA: DUF5996 family protein [Anaerolineales bacterium]|nr:DUF5996 family protein [Anaerolineales bacterium]